MKRLGQDLNLCICFPARVVVRRLHVWWQVMHHGRSSSRVETKSRKQQTPPMTASVCITTPIIQFYSTVTAVNPRSLEGRVNPLVGLGAHCACV